MRSQEEGTRGPSTTPSSPVQFDWRFQEEAAAAKAQLATVGPYAVVGMLGSGGMGAVLRVRDPAGRELAVKLSTSTSPQALERFRREGELTARLRHPGIVTIHDAGEHEGRPYLVYELVEGRDLQDLLGELSRDRLLQIVLEAAVAVAYAHDHGIIHRDLKPANLLIGDDGRVRVADFGLARASDLERLTLSGALLGTPLYMAPEQASGQREAFGPHTDVWALGGLLYQVLCAREPFAADSLTELVMAILHAQPERPCALDSSVSASLEAVCLRALEKAPADRYPDAGEFADDLRRALGGEAVEATLRTPRRTGLRLALLVATVAGVVLALAIAVGLQPSPSVQGDQVGAGEASSSAPARSGPEEAFARAQAIEEAKGPAAALNDLRAAAEAGHLDAMVRLGQILQQEQGVPRDDEQAARWFRRAAAAQHPRGMSEWGYMLCDGRGVAKDVVAARRWFRRSAEAEDPEGMSNYGSVLEAGVGGPADHDAGLIWTRRGAEAGYPVTMLNFGVALVEGKGVDPNPEEGIAFIRRAVAAGQKDALLHLARFTRAGRGTQRDPALALELYLRAGKAGLPRAWAHAGQMLIVGDEGVPSDSARGEALLRKAIEAGHTRSLTILARHLELGRLDRDAPREVLALYRRAAKGGEPEGMCRYGLALLPPGGEASGMAQASGWLHRSAEAGYAPAMFELGRLCGAGLLPGGRAEARRLFTEALAAGHEPAREALRTLDRAR